MRPLVIYHANCPDGFTAAWVAERALRRAYDEPAELFEGRHGEPPPLELAKDRLVYVVDFSYPREQLEELARAAGSMILLDHHATAHRDLALVVAELDEVARIELSDGSVAFVDRRPAPLPFPANTTIVFDMERSGAGMTWDHFHPGEPRPWIVDYVEDRDLWRFQLPHSEAIGLFIRAAEHTLEAWDLMAQFDVESVRQHADGCKRYLDHYVQDALRQSYVIDLYWTHPDEPDDFDAQRLTTTVVVNVSYTGVSDVLNAALERHPEAQMALAWHLASDGKINCSLRSVKGFDCSEFARARGGGGHAQAAGFRLPFDLSHGVVRQILGDAIPQGGFWRWHPISELVQASQG